METGSSAEVNQEAFGGQRRCVCMSAESGQVVVVFMVGNKVWKGFRIAYE